MSTGVFEALPGRIDMKDTHQVFSIDTVVDHCIHDCFFLNLDRSMLWYAKQQLNGDVCSHILGVFVMSALFKYSGTLF